MPKIGRVFPTIFPYVLLNEIRFFCNLSKREQFPIDESAAEVYYK